MMRKLIVIGVLALAGCNENEGWNPNYRMSDSAYGKHLQAREVALMTGSEPPSTIPVALPSRAPTPEEIRGPKAMQTVAASYRVETAQAEGKAPAAADLPVVTSGEYPGSTPVLVRYAFAAQHAPGTRVWARTGGSPSAAAQACRSYPDSDRAQMAFLAAGGPERDPRGMDPDGDGFVCGWDAARHRVNQL